MIKLLVILVLVFNFVLSGITPPIVNTQYGKVSGVKYFTDNDKAYYGFRGIPFAAPPIGNLRFEPPQSPEPWSDILDGTDDKKACISSMHILNRYAESEDCLYINVYTPSLNVWPSQRLPVMFWIYGGDFVQGSSSKENYSPDYLMEEDVILVTFNYRLGPLGFLSTEDEIMPGNYGLKDQNFALKWTYDNIKNFGGDPNKITIFGQSAGGASVASHILSKKSKGLFRAAIIESSSALVPWALNLDARNGAFRLGEKAGYRGNHSQELKTFLQNKTDMEIFKATDYVKLNWPVLEVHHKDAFLTESNYELLEKGDFNRVPTIIGVCSEESLAFLASLTLARLEAIAFDLSPGLLIPSSLNPNLINTIPAVANIRNLYINLNTSFAFNVTGLAKFLSDNMFIRGVIKQAELQSKFTPVYLYQFAYYGRTLIPAFLEAAEKVGHGGEVPFLFKSDQIDNTVPEDMLTQNRMIKLWTNFAKYLNPTPAKIDLLGNITWPPLTSDNKTYLNINKTLEVLPDFKKEIYTAWNEIFDKYGQKPFITY